jgi:hypothetical protein
MNRVPPGRPYNSDGRQTPPIDFGSDPKPQTNMNTQSLGVQPGNNPANPYGSQTNSYTPTNAPRLSLPTDGGAYGPPGTAGANSAYLGGASGVTNGTPLMPSGGADPRATPPLGAQPGASAAGLGTLGGAQAGGAQTGGSSNTLPY